MHRNNHRPLRRVLLPVAAALLLGAASSCNSTKDIAYFQDLTTEGVVVTQPQKPIVIRPMDKLSILVHSRDPQVSDMFNLPFVSRQLGQASRGAMFGSAEGISGYTVNEKGDIDFPILGELHVAGLTRPEIAHMIKERLIKDDLVKDPVVNVEFMNQTYAVLGEVNSKGRYAIERDNVTLLDAITRAGDLAITGRRDNVKVIRTENGVQKIYIVDMTNAESVRNSPAYYLQQDDIIYVEPNDVRKRQSTVNGNTVLSLSFYVSIASLLTSAAVLIWK